MKPRLVLRSAVIAAVFAGPSVGLCGSPTESFLIGTAAQTYTFRQGWGSLAVQSASVTAPRRMFVSDAPLAPLNPFVLPNTIISIGRPMFSLSKPATLTLGYEPEQLPSGTLESSLRIYTLRGHKWVIVGGTVNTTTKTVSTFVTGSGVYALLAATSSTANSNTLLCGLIDERNRTSGFFVVDSTGPITGGPPSLWPFHSVSERTAEFLSLTTPSYTSILSFRRQPNGKAEAYAANSDGSFPIKITNLGMQTFGPASFRQDGKFAVFPGTVGTSTSIYKLNADGTGLAAVASNVPGVPVVALNPAGTQAAYSSNGSVVIVDPATNAVLRTVALPNTSFITGLAYNPAGTQLAAIGGGTGIFTINPASGPATLRLSGDFGGPVVWSPDGLALAFKRTNQLATLRLSNNTLLGFWGDATGHFDLFKLVWR